MAPFKLNDDHQLWIEDSKKIFTIENQCILSNECLLNGSSGGPVLLDGFKTSSATDRNGYQWTFVEYSAIHFGGEYVCFKIETFVFVDLHNKFSLFHWNELEKFFPLDYFRFHVVNVYRLIQQSVIGTQI